MSKTRERERERERERHQPVKWSNFRSQFNSNDAWLQVLALHYTLSSYFCGLDIPWQCSPFQPATQRHLKVLLSISIHVPSCRHGLEAHISRTVKKRRKYVFFKSTIFSSTLEKVIILSNYCIQQIFKDVHRIFDHVVSWQLREIWLDSAVGYCIIYILVYL